MSDSDPVGADPCVGPPPRVDPSAASDPRVGPSVASAQAAAEARRYPARPIVGVGGIAFIEGRVVLIKRRFEPMAGRWSLPGGTLELGESLHDGLAREMLEETGLVVDVGPLVDLFDRVTRDPDGRVRFHYVLADYVCRRVGGRLAA
ncbi:MAG: NUDIX hydrolase, partial [Acidobacteria bacterium]|nr:NUDIX hydrolase [Acidobacteriota bacterium]